MRWLLPDKSLVHCLTAHFINEDWEFEIVVWRHLIFILITQQRPE